MAMKSIKKRHFHISMDITNRCNLLCSMCWRSNLLPSENRDMTIEQFKVIGDNCFHRASVLGLSCAAEPLMSREFYNILKAMRDYKVPAIDIATNGLLLNEKNILAMIDCRLKRIIVSIDGATAPTYESIRKGASFNRLISNLKLLRRLKQEKRVLHPILRFNFVMMHRNIEELPELVNLGARLGVQQITAQHVVIYTGGPPESESLFWHQEITNRSLIEADRLATQKGIVFNAPPLFSSDGLNQTNHRWLLHNRLVTGVDLLRQFGLSRVFTLMLNLIQRKTVRRNYRCHHPWLMMFIDLEGNIRPCMNWGNEPPLGNCFENNIDVIWNDSGYAKLRNELKGNQPLRNICRYCTAMASGRVNDPNAFKERTL